MAPKFHSNNIKEPVDDHSRKEKRDSCVSGWDWRGGKAVIAVTIQALRSREWALCPAWYRGTKWHHVLHKGSDFAIEKSVSGCEWLE